MIRRSLDHLPPRRPGRMYISDLFQREYWVNIHGERIPIDTIDARYAENIINLLRRKQSELELRVELSWIDCDFWQPNPPDWNVLEDLDVVLALRERLDPDHEWYIAPPVDMTWRDDAERAYYAWWDDTHDLREQLKYTYSWADAHHHYDDIWIDDHDVP